METQNQTLKSKRNSRSSTELRLRDALILLRLYRQKLQQFNERKAEILLASSELEELDARTSRWMKRHGFEKSRN